MITHLDLVRAVKADLEARGVDLSGPCGAFAITSRIIWALRTEGAGSLEKLTGNQCAGRAVDIICFAEGQIVDILGDAGGANLPIWQPGDAVDPARWRAPVEPVLDAGAGLPIGRGIAAAADPLPDFIAQTSARLDALAAQLQAVRQHLDDLRLELIESRQEFAIGSNALRLALRTIVLRGTVAKGLVVLRPDVTPKP